MPAPNGVLLSLKSSAYGAVRLHFEIDLLIEKFLKNVAEELAS